MNNITADLITAIQLGNAPHFALTLRAHTAKMPTLAERAHVLTKGLPMTGINALHVACMGYRHADSHSERIAFDTMISMLLEEGIEALVPCHIDGRSLTPIEVCQGDVPPSLLEHVRVRAEQQNTMHGQGVSVNMARKRSGIGEEEYLSMSRGYAGLIRDDIFRMRHA